MGTSGFAGSLKSIHGPSHRPQGKNSWTRVYIRKAPCTYMCPRSLSDASASFLLSTGYRCQEALGWSHISGQLLQSPILAAKAQQMWAFFPLEMGKMWQNWACIPYGND